MKLPSKSLLLVSFILILLACKEKSEPIVNPSDYTQYLMLTNDEALSSCEEEMVFWKNRLAKNNDDEVSILKLAGLHASRFQLNGKVEDLKISDSLYHAVLKSTPFGKSEIYQALAANSITQHEFKQARKYIQEALSIGDSKDGSLFMLTDVSLELGDYQVAKNTLKKFVNKNSFAFLIREAKIKDHEGNLDSAIVLMERALERIKETKSTFIWTKSNLADMYGHAGRVKEAYQSYLEVLKRDPNYDYALKGIAWIAFSHDKNTTEAKNIATFLQNKKDLPDAHLLLAEIADFENDKTEKGNELKLFTEKARLPKYQGMYNKYLALIEAEDLQNPNETIEIAKKEILNRPTPQSYDLLAWGYFQNGQTEKAIEIAEQYIEGQTFEPEAYYHLGVMYKNVDNRKSKRFLTEASQSSFELGPSIAINIQKQLE
jgi:tetratricopeptide (TPR) repeat protein